MKEYEVIGKYRECEDELLQRNLTSERKVYLTMAMQMYENQLSKNYNIVFYKPHENTSTKVSRSF